MTSKQESAAPPLADRISDALRTPEAPLAALCLWLIGLGWLLRLHAFDIPKTFLFDEHHFVENARNYLRGAADLNDHPPLGKLWLALSMGRLGDGPVGWRFPSLLFGVVIVAMGSVTAHRLFKRRAAALLAAAFLSIDGFLISYSRAGLLDGSLAAAAVVSVFAATLSPSGIGVVGGLAAGVAMSTKFSGVGALVPPLLALALGAFPLRRKLESASLCVGIAVALYFVCFLVGLSVMGREATLGKVFLESKRLVEHHSVLTDMKNSATSSWPTWIVPIRPLMLVRGVDGGMVRALSSLGNLALWWSACALFLSSLGWLVWRGLATFLSPPPPTSKPDVAPDAWLEVEQFLYAAPRETILLIAGALAFLAPWVLTHRDSYIYHFLPSYSLLLILLAGFVARIFTVSRAHAVAFVAVVAVVAGIYGPLWSFMPISETALRQRLFLGSWR